LIATLSEGSFSMRPGSSSSTVAEPAAIPDPEKISCQADPRMEFATPRHLVSYP
jgi:hypothetical protein